MLLSVLAIWKRPPIARSMEIDESPTAIASSKRSSTNMATASAFFARASLRRAPTARNTAIASAYASTASCTRPT